MYTDDPGGDDAWWENRLDFADPGGTSALRAETPTNPRNLPCPTCGWPNRLTPKDVALHYQCDSCANVLEGQGEIDYYDDYLERGGTPIEPDKPFPEDLEEDPYAGWNPEPGTLAYQEMQADWEDD